MSEAGTDIQEPGGPDQPASAAKRFNVVVFLIALGTLGILLFLVYRAIASIRKDADEVGRFFGLLAPRPSKSRLSRIGNKS
jgi:hypothetical protein